MAKKTVKKATSKKSKEDASGLFVPAGIFIGMGLGMIWGAIGAGIMLGLGVGFLSMAISKLVRC